MIRCLPALCLAALSACSSPSSTFYRLASDPTAEKASADLPDLSVGVGPVVMPTYVEGPQIATLSGKHVVQLNEFHRWAEPLTTAVPHAIAEDLSALLGTDRVATFPNTHWSRFDVHVVINVSQFGGSLGGDCVLTARYALVRSAGGEVLLADRFSSSAKTANDSYAAMVAAMNRCLGEFSRAIATDLEQHAAALSQAPAKE